jgi:hypothetical protein
MPDDEEMIGVDVWLAGTIYVPADNLAEAEKIVARRYAGTIAIPETYDLQGGEDLPLDGEDFMSSAVTLYGVCSGAEIKPKDTQSPRRDQDAQALLKTLATYPDIAVAIERAGLGEAFRAAVTQAKDRANV